MTKSLFHPLQPTHIDLVSDDDNDGISLAGPAAPAPLPEPARRANPPRGARHLPLAERFAGMRCLYPPGGGPGAVEVTAADLSRLDEAEFLNDTIIDFYLRCGFGWGVVVGSSPFLHSKFRPFVCKRPVGPFSSKNIVKK
jgi:hypothetical protein